MWLGYCKCMGFVLRSIEAVPDAIFGVLYRSLCRHEDGRGWLVELYREDEVSDFIVPVMSYISMTLPGVVRGPHEHRFQTDYFSFIGPGDFEIFLWDARVYSPTYGVHTKTACGESNPCAIMVPPGVVHAYRNVGDVPGWVLNSPDRLYAGWGKSGDVDEIRHEIDPNSPFKLL